MRATVGFGSLLVLLAFAGIGTHAGLGALIGLVVSVANFAALNFLAGRILAGGGAKQSALVGLLMLKLGLLGAICFVLIVRLGVDGLGFAIGCGGLVLAIFTASLLPAPPTVVGEES
jgi:hypothetical protein